MSEVLFFYDVVCPFAYLASMQIQAIADEAGVTLRWKPMLLGGLMRKVGTPERPMDHMAPSKAVLTAKDLDRQAELLGTHAHYPANHPIRTVKAMRLLIATPEAKRPALSRALYEAYWHDNADVADPTVLAPIAAAHGIDIGVIDDPAVKQALFDATDEAHRYGAFGAPTIVVDGTLYWGADRLPLVRKALGLSPHAPLQSASGGVVRIYHDFSSPYSYLGAMRIEALAARQDWP